MRKTKIICTIGPACSDEKTLIGMCQGGMNVARLNFSHGTHDEHRQKIELIKKVRKELSIPLPILLDTKGPEYRIKRFENGKITLNCGDKFTFTARELIGNEKIVSVNYKNLPNELEVGSKILLNNGMMTFEVEKIVGEDIFCNVVEGGVLSDNKSMSFPNKVLKQVYLSEQDKLDISFGVQNDVDFIACSFVSVKQDLIDIKEYLHKIGGDNIDIIAKIENQSGVDNIDEILSECDGIMIGRGDMGVEIPFEQLPAIQKFLITKCRLLGKRVITATEMLESMTNNPRPTRAETSDVANAVYDGTSAIMLSGETAAGKHPVLAVETMAKIASETEKNINYKKRFLSSEPIIKNTTDAISHSTCGVALDINAKAIAACTISGATARMVSRFRPPVDILGITTDQKTWRKLSMSWGVIPVISDTFDSSDVLFYSAKMIASNELNLKKGDKIVICGGSANGIPGKTNLIKVETI